MRKPRASLRFFWLFSATVLRTQLESGEPEPEAEATERGFSGAALSVSAPSIQVDHSWACRGAKLGAHAAVPCRALRAGDPCPANLSMLVILDLRRPESRLMTLEPWGGT